MQVSGIKKINLVLQLVAWVVFISVPIFNNRLNEMFWRPESVLYFIMLHVSLAALFYTNYFWLLHKILPSKGIIMYLTWVILLIALVYLLVPLIVQVIHNGYVNFHLFRSPVLIPAIQVWAVSTAWKLLTDYLAQRMREKNLQIEKRSSELKFLRSQINPHFLFNTLNNINSLIRSNPTKAEQSVVELAAIMRYMLRTSSQGKVKLIEELNYIKDYINLQRLRLIPEFNLVFECPDYSGSSEIEPLLLISFIENTFKHGIHGAQDDFIHIIIHVDQQQLTLITRNRIVQESSGREIESGVGVENVKKRLELLYHKNYSLDISQENNVYSIKLSLHLTKND